MGAEYQDRSLEIEVISWWMVLGSVSGVTIVGLWLGRQGRPYSPQIYGTRRLSSCFREIHSVINVSLRAIVTAGIRHFSPLGDPAG